MSTDIAIGIISTLLSRSGRQLTTRETKLLRKDPAKYNADQRDDPKKFTEDQSTFESIDEYVTRGFYQTAAVGGTFADVGAIKQYYGRSLEENYPEAGPAFLKFAYSFWTLQLVVRGPGFDPRRSLAEAMLSQLEGNIASVFFPTPGPSSINYKLRKEEQRRLLTLLCPQIDIEDFIAKNPILLRDKASKRSGCAMFLLFALGVAGIISLIALALMIAF